MQPTNEIRMNTKLNTYLINNTFEVDEAKELVIQLLSEKVAFVKDRIYALEEKFGITSPNLNQRLVELNKAIEEVNEFMEQIDEEAMDVRVQCPINIELVPSKMTQANR